MIAQQVKTVLELYRGDKLLQSAALLRKVEDGLDGPARKRLDDDEPLLRVIRKEGADLEKLFADLKHAEGWTPSYNGKNTKVSYMLPTSADDGLLTFKQELTLGCNFQNLTCLLREVDLYTELFWFLKEARTVKDETLMRKIAYIRTKLLIPGVWDRDFCSYVLVVDALEEHNAILVYSRDLKDRDDKSEEYASLLNEQAPSTVRGSLTAVTMFEAVDPFQSKITAIFKLDIGLRLVSAPVINFLAKIWLVIAPKILLSKAAELTPLHQQKLQTEEFYEMFRERILENWRKNGKEEAIAKFHQGSEVPQTLSASDRREIEAAKKGPGTGVLLSFLKSG